MASYCYEGNTSRGSSIGLLRRIPHSPHRIKNPRSENDLGFFVFVSGLKEI